MKNTKNKIFRILIIVLFYFFVSTGITHAANIGFSPAAASYNIGDTINVKIYIGTNGASVNAIAAKVKFSTDKLTLLSVSKTGSILNLWAQEPTFSNSDGVAYFEGVILNGYSGNSGTAVTLIFKAKNVGVANLSFVTASVLANDGNGTEVLYNKDSSSLTIKTPTDVIKLVVENKKVNTFPSTRTKDMTIAISEIKNNSPIYSPNKFLITTTQPVSDKSYQIQIDSLTPIIWVDDGSHVYQAPRLDNGIHIIKVMAVDTSSNQLSGFLNFTSIILKVPEITYYTQNLYVGDFLVLKGNSDPLTNIELTITNKETSQIIVDNIISNSDGKFTYVPERELIAGMYLVVARTTSTNNISSEYTDPILVVNQVKHLNYFVDKLSNIVIILIPLLALLLLFIILSIAVYRGILKYKKFINEKIKITKGVVSKNFETLDRDVDEEIVIFKKVREHEQLSEYEKKFLDKFKVDIIEAEKVINKEISEINQ